MFLNAFPNLLANVLFYVLTISLFVFEGTIARRKVNGAKQKDGGSVIILFISILVCFILFLFLLKNGIALFPHNLHWLSWVGFSMIVLGFSFRFYSIRVLGKYFTGVVMIQKGHEIIKKGPYKILRHPSYTGGLIYFSGIGLATNDWLIFLFFMLAQLLSYIFRIRVEEEVMIEHFGDDYRDYQKETWRLIPYIY